MVLPTITVNKHTSKRKKSNMHLWNVYLSAEIWFGLDTSHRSYNSSSLKDCTFHQGRQEGYKQAFLPPGVHVNVMDSQNGPPRKGKEEWKCQCIQTNWLE